MINTPTQIFSSSPFISKDISVKSFPFTFISIDASSVSFDIANIEPYSAIVLITDKYQGNNTNQNNVKNKGEYYSYQYWLCGGALLIALIYQLGGHVWIKNSMKAMWGNNHNQINHNELPPFRSIEQQLLSQSQDYSDYYPYFRVPLQYAPTENEQLSPRKSKLVELKKKMGMGLFEMIKEYNDRRRNK